MPLSWKLYRIICVLQMTAAGFNLISGLLDSFRSVSFGLVARLLLFLLVILLSIFAVNTLNNNYPDTPIAGNQKKTFNRLFLLNFIFLAFLFGFLISEFRLINELSTLTGKHLFQLPVSTLLPLIVYALTLVFQFIILYGLYNLRRVLYINFMKQTFEFENS